MVENLFKKVCLNVCKNAFLELRTVELSAYGKVEVTSNLYFNKNLGTI